MLSVKQDWKDLLWEQRLLWNLLKSFYYKNKSIEEDKERRRWLNLQKDTFKDEIDRNELRWEWRTVLQNLFTELHDTVGNF